MAISGLVLIDKPTSFTSHDVVAKVRKALGTKKVGHAGTLDPLATGLLVLGINAGTKFLTFLVGADKSYQATIRLGQSRISDDSESEIIETAPAKKLLEITDEQIAAEITKLTGEIMQQPSAVSAIKVAGSRAYDLVRAGEIVELVARKVKVYRFELLSKTVSPEGFIDLVVSVDCSSGTYIRALARDLGKALGVGGHIISLRRTRVGSFDVADANSITELDNLKITPLYQAATTLLPVRNLTDQEVIDLVHGKKIPAAGQTDSLIAGVSAQEKLIAVLEPADSDLKSVVVFQGELND